MATPAFQPIVELRDPVHGAIPVTQGELRVIDTPLFQRLRAVRQLGFAEHVFPGAVHHRYLHSIGAMHLAGDVATRVLAPLAVPPADKLRLTAVARLAALLHDVGHPPLSHAAESLLPTRAALLGPQIANPDHRASHEDMTARILTASPLAEVLDREYAPLDITAALVAQVIAEPTPAHPALHAAGIDFGPLLHQLVSGELDVDRMDYLIRDSTFTGVQYGNYDRSWLLSHLRAHVQPARSSLAPSPLLHEARLALDTRALPAFEHFLLARYHMFQMVYFHPISDAYDVTLRHWLAAVGTQAELPATMDAFVGCTDAWLYQRLESSDDPWAQRISSRRPLALLAELRTPTDRAARPQLAEALNRAGFEVFWHTAKPVLSRYATTGATGLSVIDTRPPFGPAPRIQRLEDATDLYARYTEVLQIERAYVRPEERRAARTLLASLSV